MARRPLLVRLVTSAAAAAIFGATLLHGADQGSPLADAAMKGDMAAVRALLQATADVNGTQADGTTALHWAVYNDNLALVERLIAARADVTTANEFGSTPLAEAATVGNAAVIAALLEAGAAVDAASRRGRGRCRAWRLAS